MRITDINNWIQPTIYHAIKEQRLKKDTGQRERERERERERLVNHDSVESVLLAFVGTTKIQSTMGFN